MLGGAVEEQDALHERFRVFHFANGLPLDVFGKFLVALVFAHFCVQKILVDGGEFFAQGFVQLFEDFWRTPHGVTSREKWILARRPCWGHRKRLAGTPTPPLSSKGERRKPLNLLMRQSAHD
jgi:hypothetical protein